MEYVSWVENNENELHISKEIDGILYNIQYRPVDYIVAKEKRKLELPKVELEERVSKLNGAQYYSLRLNKAEGNEDILLYKIQGEQDYYERVNYCNAAMAEDIKLIEGKDTLYCTLFQYVPTYGVAPYADFVFSFDDKKYQGDKILLFNDRIFGAGELQFQIKEDAIKNIPDIITE